jgi:hypothetical protein
VILRWKPIETIFITRAEKHCCASRLAIFIGFKPQISLAIFNIGQQNLIELQLELHRFQLIPFRICNHSGRLLELLEGVRLVTPQATKFSAES